MASGKEIKSRIKTVKNTGKITKAMELISTVKMKKAQESVMSLRQFALSALAIFETISADENTFAAYTTVKNHKRELIVVMASQKGLCGGYNVNIFKKLMEYLKNEKDGGYHMHHHYATVGKRARDFIVRTGHHLDVDFSDEIPDPVKMADSRKLATYLTHAWKSGQYAKISLVHSQYISALTQTPIVKPIFPLNQKEIQNFLHRIAHDEGDKNNSQIHKTLPKDILVEPSPEVVLEYAIPLIINAVIHESILEARASEHAARMVAMKNAKDAAKKKASVLTLAYNKARQ